MVEHAASRIMSYAKIYKNGGRAGFSEGPEVPDRTTCSNFNQCRSCVELVFGVTGELYAFGTYLYVDGVDNV